MSKLYKQVEILVSRAFYHGGSGLEDEGLRFFRCHTEYRAEARKHGWDSGNSFKTSWCVRPILLKALVEGRKWKQFLAGQALDQNDVAFFAPEAERVAQISWANG